MEKTEFIPTKECPKCRAKNELSAKFCHDCNSPLEIEGTDFLCQYCNTKNDSLSRFCKSCGKKMREDTRDPDIELLETYLGDKFSISKPLGEGGFGRVFLADHIGLGRKEVIKLLGFEQSKNIEIKSRFLQEARILASLNHPHIIPVRDVSEAEGRPYYIMEYKNGGSLQDQLKKKKNLPIIEAKEIVLKLLSALTLVHKQGILHRDIKPDNILLSDTGEPVLIDFGIARLEDSSTANKTRTGIAIGTPAYMSPEQWEGKKIDARSDLYSVGILLYELITGQVPFSSHEVFSKELPHETSLPEELYLFLQKACAKDPKNRFSTSEEMSTTLRNLIVSTNPKKSKIPHLKEPSESVEPVSGTQKKRSEFILDFLHPFRKELTWKSILLKQLRIFLSISVIPLVVWVGIIKNILMEMPICTNSKMVMDGLYCYHEADKNSLQEAENICKSNYKNIQKIDDKKCIEKNYTGTIKLNSFMEKPFYEYRSNYFAKYYPLTYYLILIYPLFISFHIIYFYWKKFKYLIMLMAILPLFYFLYISYIKKDIWTGIVYPDKNNLYDYKIIGSFDTLNFCLDRVNTIAGEKGSYECGLNYKMESTPMICEKTIGNEK
jgi:serine/threonine protein kinase